MEFTDVIESRKSIRTYCDKEVEDDKIQKILDAGRWAPSFANIQPWEFIVVTDPDVKSQLSQIGVRITLFSKGINEASAVIVVVVDPEKDPYHYIEDGSVATQNMALAAHSLGLSTYWIGLFNLQKTRDSHVRSRGKLIEAEGRPIFEEPFFRWGLGFGPRWIHLHNQLRAADHTAY